MILIVNIKVTRLFILLLFYIIFIGIVCQLIQNIRKPYWYFISALTDF